MNILNGNEAFAAMMAGRNILCRAVGELIEFDDLDRFPATIFATPGYEFCIKVETMELAGITFAKPLTLDDVAEDQEIFMVYPDHISQIKYSKHCGEYFAGVRNGFAQADQQNAELQLQAIGELFGRVICYPPTIDNTGKTKKRRSRKIEEPAANDQNSTSNDVEEKTFESQSYIQSIEQGQITAVEESLIEEFIETNPVKLVEKFTAQISQFTNTQDVLSFRHVFLANGHLDQKDQQHLCKLTEDKLLALDPEQYTPKLEPSSGELSVDELKRLQEEAEKFIQSQKYESLEQPVQADEDAVYKELLADLLDRVAKSISPMEANAQIKYTKSWTPEQRAPLISAINKRLVELNPPKAQLSLAVRIQRAEDLTELDGLEIDVSACDEEIQPRLMELVNKRRLELDPFNIALEGS
ncbi:hypothetical protein ACBQ24_12015 [Acinetobacter terrestris]|uniref:hypothetical protein n=1 Tax=Acinetobacter terrestris TaxID=2529843 RepID=UPI0035264963